MAEITAEGKKLKLCGTNASITVKLGDKVVLRNGLTAIAHCWTEKGFMAVLIEEDRYMSQRGLEVMAFNVGDDDIFG